MDSVEYKSKSYTNHIGISERNANKSEEIPYGNTWEIQLNSIN